MKFNVRPCDCNFIVNKDKGTVVCIYDGCEEDFVSFISSNACKSGVHVAMDYSLYKRMLMPNRFVGVARCGANDEWNEETGRLIAFSRMKDKLNKSFFKRAQTYTDIVVDWLNDSIDLLNDVGAKLADNQTKRHERITELVGEKNKEDT